MKTKINENNIIYMAMELFSQLSYSNNQSYLRLFIISFFEAIQIHNEIKGSQIGRYNLSDVRNNTKL